MSHKRDPETRKNEILKASEQLFLTQGYEATTVEHILQRTGLSKGGFYHHFKAKDDVLMTLLDRITDETVQAAKEIADRSGDSALQKLAFFFKHQLELKLPKAEMIRAFYEEREHNPQFHRQNAMIWDKYVPVISGIVLQGVEEGSMTAKHPEETVRLLFGAITSLYDFYPHGAGDGMAADIIRRYVEAFEEIFIKALGIDEGALRIFENGIPEGWIGTVFNQAEC